MDCGFYREICAEARIKWLKAEYKESKINLPADIKVDEKIEVSNNGEDWVHRHFARFEDGSVRAWSGGNTSWTTKKHIYLTMQDYQLKTIN